MVQCSRVIKVEDFSFDELPFDLIPIPSPSTSYIGLYNDKLEHTREKSKKNQSKRLSSSTMRVSNSLRAAADSMDHWRTHENSLIQADVQMFYYDESSSNWTFLSYGIVQILQHKLEVATFRLEVLDKQTGEVNELVK